ncbi:unnamed protein product [Brassica oleracea]|uniref:Uncharacterized protein n=2 Tax=Brassica TaxID=3705 RepID=A0A3P6H5Q4_BRAOL|nr:unnamed protein product [Brassica oleracea]
MRNTTRVYLIADACSSTPLNLSKFKISRVPFLKLRIDLGFLFKTGEQEEDRKSATMGGEGEDLEPLFDYHRVQPSNFVCIDDDDDSDVSEVPVRKRSKTSHTVVKKDEEDVKVIEIACDDDWLPPPPKVVFDKSKESGEDSTIKALR